MNWKKAISLILSAALILPVVLTGCSPAPAASSASGGDGSGETITITDQAGAEVTLPAQIDRIAVCDIFPLPSVLAVFFDSADKIVAMAPTSMSAAQNSLLSQLYPEILDADTSAMSGTDVNTEELMKLDPQVVFYSAANTQLGATLTRAGFNAVAISTNKWEYNAVETLNQWIDLLSQIFPDNDRAQLVHQYSQESLRLVQDRTADLSDAERARVFFLFQYTDSSIVTSGKNFFGQWWADAIGAVNAAQELTEDNSVKVNLEQVYAWNPDTILLTNFTAAQPQDLYNSTIGTDNWSTVDAVVNHRVYKMPLGMYRSYTPGVDTPITLLWLAKAVYPELFSDVNITDRTIDYYKTVFGVDLTEQQAESIFAPAANAGQTDF